MEVGKINRRMPIGLAALGVQVAAALTLPKEVPLGVPAHLGKVLRGGLVLAV
jgi:hypothetical protein